MDGSADEEDVKSGGRGIDDGPIVGLDYTGKNKERMEAEVMIKLATMATMDCTGERKSRAKAFLSRIHIAGFPVL